MAFLIHAGWVGTGTLRTDCCIIWPGTWGVQQEGGTVRSEDRPDGEERRRQAVRGLTRIAGRQGPHKRALVLNSQL